MTVTIRPIRPSDYRPVIAVIDDWWNGRRMADMLPRLFFEHFTDTCFAAERDGELAGFLVGFTSQSRPGEAYIHLFLAGSVKVDLIFTEPHTALPAWQVTAATQPGIDPGLAASSVQLGSFSSAGVRWMRRAEAGSGRVIILMGCSGAWA
jgi:hypothetical protein